MQVEHFAQRQIDGWRVMRRITDSGIRFEFLASDEAVVYVTEASAARAAQDMQDAWMLFLDEFGPWPKSFAA